MGKFVQMSDPFIARHGDSVVPHRRGLRYVIMNKDTPMGKKTEIPAQSCTRLFFTFSLRFAMQNLFFYFRKTIKAINATGYPRCAFDFDWDHRFIIFANLSDRVRRTLRDLLSVFVTTGDVEVGVDKGSPRDAY